MYTTCPDGQLVYTPPAKNREGLLGYVLRLSEANGYDTPWHILKMAGLTQSQMTSASLPIGKLSRLIGRPVQELEQLPWQRYPNGDSVPTDGRAELLAHLLLKHPKICPHCVAENGFVDPAWDLRLMLACPTHGITLVNRCPACQRKLSWFRPGLLRCRCGHDITTAEHPAYPQHTLDLLQVIYDTVHGLPTNPRPPSRIPANDLHRMGIDDLLKLLGKVGNALIGNEPRGKYNAWSQERLERIATFFQDWPKHFHHFLRTNDPRPNQATLGLVRRFEDFYRSVVMAKRIPREKMLFFRAAFGQYGSYYGVNAGADPRFFLSPQKWRALRKNHSVAQIRRQTHEKSAPTDVINQTELAKQLGVQGITVRRWAEQGLFGLKREAGTVGGQAFYKPPSQLPRRATGTLDTRKAAKYLEIPVSILERLRRDGYYCAGYFGTRVTQFNQLDLNKLRIDLLGRAPATLSTLPAEHVTLTAFFRMKLYGVENKYQIVRNILDGTLVPAGHLGKNIGDIAIANQSIEAFRQDMTVHDAIPAIRAAKILECDASVCTTLVAIGQLEGIYHGRFLYVTTESLASFQKRYISCVSIANRLGTSSRRVTRMLLAEGIDLLRVQRTYRSNITPQAFCSTQDAERAFGQNTSPLFYQEESARELLAEQYAASTTYR